MKKNTLLATNQYNSDTEAMEESSDEEPKEKVYFCPMANETFSSSSSNYIDEMSYSGLVLSIKHLLDRTKILEQDIRSIKSNSNMLEEDYEKLEKKCR